MRAYQLTSESKIKGCQAFLQVLIESRSKFLVFAHHYQMLDQLEDLMLRTKTSYIRIDGQIALEKRHEAVSKFQ